MRVSVVKRQNGKRKLKMGEFISRNGNASNGTWAKTLEFQLLRFSRLFFFLPLSFFFHCFRQLLGNGTLYFPPFLAQDFRAEVHNARYRCRATSSVGTVLSREVTLRAGEFVILLVKFKKSADRISNS